MIRSVVFAIALLVASHARAMDLGEYLVLLQTDAGRAIARAWLDGFGSGVGTYEVRQAMDGRPKRICQPQGVRFSAELLAGLIDATIKETPQLAQPAVPVDAVIWIALQRRFPCAPSKSS